MDTSTSIALAAVLFAVACVYYYCRRKLSYWSRNGVEQLPSPHWFFGHYKEGILFQSSPGWHLGQLYKRARQNAPFVGFYIFHKPCILLRDPKLIKHMFTRDFNIFANRYYAGDKQKDSIGLRNLFAVRGPEWKVMRQKMGPVLNNSMKEKLALMLDVAAPMMRFIDSQKGKLLDAQEFSFRYAGDLIATMALGTKTDAFGNPNGDCERNMTRYFYSLSRMIALVSVFFMPDLVDRTGSLLYFDSKFIRKIFWKAMEKRMKTGEKRGDFIDFATQFQKGPQSQLYKFSDDNLVHQAGTFFSGFESSATNAAFTLRELARCRQLQDRARADIRQAVDRHGWSYEAFLEMNFLEKCLYEAMRMHPQISTLDRRASKDYKIPGTEIMIKKGTAVYVSIYGLHEDPMHFEDPGTFNPDRFANTKVTPEAYIPFGVGPRMCSGTKIGVLHAKVVVSMILAQYEITQAPEEKHILDPISTFTLAEKGVMINCTKLAEGQLVE